MIMTAITNKHPKEIAARLQLEIDLILNKVDDLKMYAEFREEEMIDIQDGSNHQVFREVLDERIHYNMNRRAQQKPLIEKTVYQSVHQTKKAKKFLDYLFKPFAV